MARSTGGSDPRPAAARYRAGAGMGPDAAIAESSGETSSSEQTTADPPRAEPSLGHHAQYVRVAIEQAERRGDFDDLPGAGKPIADLGRTHDPDWWIRQKIEREKITGLGPPALTLRTENRELDARLDAVASERSVREILDDFNRRVIDARRQLEGGPPVVTPTREVEHELLRWRERREARLRAAEVERGEADADARASTWRERWRARRARGR